MNAQLTEKVREGWTIPPEFTILAADVDIDIFLDYVINGN